MDVPEIESLVSQAIENRPKVTNAPMNLYIHNGNIVCGARIVMPESAIFVTHLSPHQFEEGLSDREWLLVVEKIRTVTEMGKVSESAGSGTGLRPKMVANLRKLQERRREQRLLYRWPIMFAENINESFVTGQICDVASGGLAFTCVHDDDRAYPGREIITRFKVPCFGPDNTIEKVSFDRSGRICRVNNLNGLLQRIAIQFAKPLPFKPAEQGIDNLNARKSREFVKA